MNNQLTQLMNNKNLQALILTDGYNIHHLSGYRGHTGVLAAFGREQYILTDSRYTEQVELEAPEFTCVDIGREGYSKTEIQKFNIRLNILWRCMCGWTDFLMHVGLI